MSLRRSSRFMHGLISTGFVFSIACLCTISASSRAQEKGESPAGLAGVLPDSTPFDLSEDAFITLGDSWKDWSVGVAAEVTKLYEGQLDSAGQRATLVLLNKKIGTMEKAMADRRYRVIYDPLMTMHARLARRVAVAEAALDTLELDPAVAHAAHLKRVHGDVVAQTAAMTSFLNEVNGGKPWIGYLKLDQLSKADTAIDVFANIEKKIANAGMLKNEAQRAFMQRDQFAALGGSLKAHITAVQSAAPTYDKAQLRTSLTGLLAAIEAYEEEPISESTVAIRTALAEAQKHSPDHGDRIVSTVKNHYMNFNVRIVASEKFLNKMVAYAHSDNRPVDDWVLGAKVDGPQTTSGTVGIDLQPSANTIRFLMTFDGVTQSRTQGVTDQATIFTSGYHSFRATKEVSFDGDVFKTRPTGISVNANNTTTGARTKYSSLLLLGGIADNYAVGEARKRKSDSEAIARQKLSAQVVPEFNEQVDAEFKKHSTQMQEKVIPKLHDADLYPHERAFRSSESELWSNILLMGDKEVGGDAPIFTTNSAKGMAIHLHQSAINNVMSKLTLAGRTLTEAELAAEISRSLNLLLGTNIEMKPAGEPDPTKFVFPSADVLRVKISDGELTLSLRAGLKTADDDIPTQIITIPLSFAIEGNDIVVSAGKVNVVPVDPPENRVEAKVRASVVETKVQKALPTRKADRFIDVNRSQGAPVKLAITEIKPLAGWLSIVIE